VLATIAGLAQRGVAGAAAVSVTLVTRGTGSTVAFTGDLARALDESQYERGYGPCLDASEVGAPLFMVDAATENRWPAFTRRAVELGVHSSMSLPLPVQEAVTGALNLYAEAPHAFDDAARRTATTFAEYAAVAVANAHSLSSATALVEQMRHAAASRSVIDQAKGIVMARRGCNGEAAIDVLILAARKAERRLCDVAAVLVTSAQGLSLSPADADLLAVVEGVRTQGTAPD